MLNVRSALRLMTVCALLTLCLCAEAQGFVNLTARQVRIDSVLPVYTWQKALGAGYADSVYTVSIEYPEFVDMSANEVRRYQEISDEPLPALPEVSQTVGVARKQGMLDVSFVPLVFRDGRYQKLVSFKLNVQAKARAVVADRARTRAMEGSRYASHSVLRSGNWAKIRVPASGVYQLTEALIREAGFTDLSHVRVYGYGGALQPERLTAAYLTMTDDLREVPTCMVNGRRLFRAVGPVTWESPTATVRIRNPYSDDGYYFLTEDEGEPLTVTEETFVADYPTAADYHTLYEVDDYAWYHGGRNLFDKTLFGKGLPQTYTLTASGTTGTLSVALTYNSSFEATVAVNGVAVGTVGRTVVLDSYTEAAEYVWDFPLNDLQAENTVQITQTSGGDLRLDYLSLRLDTPRPMVDLATADLPVPEYVYMITNQDHHADEAVDMVMIIPTSQKLLAQAERLKAHHEQTDGLRVRIVPADELYNEFSSGTPDATAYRRYMKMLYDRAATEADTPRYLLLMGDGAWDNRMRTQDWADCDLDDFLLCFESENSFSHVNCYVSDDFFCLLDDEETIADGQTNGQYSGKPDVAVGRFPARTAEEAAVLVDKTIAYATNAQGGAWQNVVCMMGDDGNNNVHMTTADKVATMVANDHPGYQVKKIYWDAYQRTSSSTGYAYPDVTRQIRQQLNDGALMMNYCGHGAAYALSHELVMKLADFETSTSKGLPLWVTASCDIMPFDGQEENIGETVMFNSKGGGIAFFGTTRTVYATYNEAMNLAFTGYVLTPGVTIGEAARLAKCELVSRGRDMSPNKLQYTLLGDPALRLACPTATVVIDSINGQAADEDIKLQAGSVVQVVGHLQSGHGQETVACNSSGTITVVVRDAEETITCRLNDSSDEGADEPFVYTDRRRTLYHGSDSVRNGLFRFTFAVPTDISYTDGSGLMTLYAISNDKTVTAHGEYGGFVLSGSSDTQTDSVGPSIHCYLNAKTFVNGGRVNTTPYFVAELYDDSGINASGSSIGRDLELVIERLQDGQGRATGESWTYNLNDYFAYDFGDYRSGTVGFSIPALDEGAYRLRFRAWDVVGNSSVTELAFNVVKDLTPGDISVVCTKNPATTNTSFVVSHDRMGSEITVTLDIFDMAGRQLWKQRETVIPVGHTYTVDWDLRLASGSRLQAGVYIYRIQVGCAGSGTASYANKLMVLSNN